MMKKVMDSKAKWNKSNNMPRKVNKENETWSSGRNGEEQCSLVNKNSRDDIAGHLKRRLLPLKNGNVGLVLKQQHKYILSFGYTFHKDNVVKRKLSLVILRRYASERENVNTFDYCRIMWDIQFLRNIYKRWSPKSTHVLDN